MGGRVVGERAALWAALALQLDWGADEALGEEPVDRTRSVTDAGPMPARVVPQGGVFAPAVARAGALASGVESLEMLRAAMAALDTPLRDTAGRLVLADGVAGSGLVLVGEAPGAEEDREGRPFVGVSGRLLDRMLASIGVSRETNAYLTNILPYRPPGNRTPSEAEVKLFAPFALRHLALVRPRQVVLLGGTAAKALLRSKEGITRLRGRWRGLEVPGLGLVPALPTLHPAYLLRQPAAKREAWADLRLLRRVLDGAPTGIGEGVIT